MGRFAAGHHFEYRRQRTQHSEQRHLDGFKLFDTWDGISLGERTLEFLSDWRHIEGSAATYP
jgi:hypothetical protein